MKSLLSLILGLSIAVALFVGALAVTAWFISSGGSHAFANLDAKPMWTSQPVKIDPGAQSFERLAAAPVPPVYQAMAVDLSAQEKAARRMAQAPKPENPGIDDTTTGAVEAGAMAGLDGTPHAEWCFERYRSYRIEDNSYRSYSGELRKCESPFLHQAMTARGADHLTLSDASPQQATYAPTAAGDEKLIDDQADDMREQGYEDRGYGMMPPEATTHASGDHVNWCLQRYNSYRPDDNTYQPFDGPRRTCDSPFG